MNDPIDNRLEYLNQFGNIRFDVETLDSSIYEKGYKKYMMRVGKEYTQCIINKISLDEFKAFGIDINAMAYQNLLACLVHTYTKINIHKTNG